MRALLLLTFTGAVATVDAAGWTGQAANKRSSSDCADAQASSTAISTQTHLIVRNKTTRCDRNEHGDFKTVFNCTAGTASSYSCTGADLNGQPACAVCVSTPMNNDLTDYPADRTDEGYAGVSSSTCIKIGNTPHIDFYQVTSTTSGDFYAELQKICAPAPTTTAADIDQATADVGGGPDTGIALYLQ